MSNRQLINDLISHISFIESESQDTLQDTQHKTETLNTHQASAFQLASFGNDEREREKERSRRAFEVESVMTSN